VRDLRVSAGLERLPGCLGVHQVQQHLHAALGVQGFFQQNATDWGSVMACLVVMLLPSAIIFAVFNKYFSVGGIGGSTRWALTSSVDQKGQPECRENIKIGP
jgi:hypothetical protein